MTQDEIDISIWATRDGREIPLEEMPRPHIENAIAVLSKWRRQIRTRVSERNTYNELSEWLRRFRQELRRRAKRKGRHHGQHDHD